MSDRVQIELAEGYGVMEHQDVWWWANPLARIR